MLPRHPIQTPAWRLAALLLASLAVAGPPVPALALPDVPDGPSAPAVSGPGQSAPDQARLAAAYGQLPLSFEANQGQADPAVDFVAHGQGYSLFLSSGAATLSLHEPPSGSGSSAASIASAAAGSMASAASALTHASLPTSATVDQPAGVVRLQLVGSNPQPQAISQQQLPGTANYFIGTDPSQWHTGIPTYAQVRYQGVYPGVDLVYYGHQGQLEDDFVVAPGAEPQAIRLVVEGAEGVDVNTNGTLVIHTSDGDVSLQPPTLYQEMDGVRQAVWGAYVLDEAQQVGFAVDIYDRTRPLVIDPVLVYSTLLGGALDPGLAGGGFADAFGIAVDAAGNAYLTGHTGSVEFPTTPGAYQRTFHGPGANAFVAKLNATGSGLVYSTFLVGGSGDNEGHAIAVDTAGNAYVTGHTSSVDSPTTPGAFQRTLHGTDDAFVTKLNGTGMALVYSTFLGGSAGEGGSGIAVDAAGNAYVTGRTASADFPTKPGAFQRTPHGYLTASSPRSVLDHPPVSSQVCCLDHLPNCKSPSTPTAGSGAWS